MIRPGTGCCDAAAVDAASLLWTATCYSPCITPAPGQVEGALYDLPSPYPADKTVGVVHQSSNLIEAGTGRLVPLSEAYVRPALGFRLPMHGLAQPAK